MAARGGKARDFFWVLSSCSVWRSSDPASTLGPAACAEKASAATAEVKSEMRLCLNVKRVIELDVCEPACIVKKSMFVLLPQTTKHNFGFKVFRRALLIDSRCFAMIQSPGPQHLHL
jgi:hypothetical protein